MAILEIEGRRVEVEDAFLQLSPEEQEATVQEIAASLPPQDVAWSDVPGQAMSNLGSSAAQAASDLAQPFLHPIDTANALGDIAGGVAAKAGIGDHDQTAADSVGEFFANRYGGMEELKRTMANDPVGFLSDVGTILSAGGLAGARATGVAGRVAQVARAAGDTIDPVSLAMRGTAAATRGVGNVAARTAGMMSGVGAAPIREMAAAGRAGGVAQDAAVGAMRGSTPLEDITDDARGALSDMRHQRNSEYQADIANVRADNQQLSFRDTFRAIGQAQNDLTYRGKTKDQTALNAVNEARDLVREFRNDPNMHTPAGFDTLKQRLDELRAQHADGSRAQTMVGKISNAVRDTATAASSDYNRALTSYSADSAQIKSLEREFSLKHGSNDNTALRKLLASLRNNVNTNFGRREEMMRELNERRPTLAPAIAGASLREIEPRGLARVLANPITAGLGTAGAMMTNPWMLAALPPAALASMPRVAGEVALKAGQASRHLSPEMRRLVSASSYQVGRVKREAEEGKKEKRGD